MELYEGTAITAECVECWYEYKNAPPRFTCPACLTVNTVLADGSTVEGYFRVVEVTYEYADRP